MNGWDRCYFDHSRNTTKKLVLSFDLTMPDTSSKQIQSPVNFSNITTAVALYELYNV